MANAELKFEAVAYANIDADLTALNRGEVDCVFPADGTGVRVAVNEGNANYDCFPETAFPAWKPVYFPTTKDCLHIDDYKALFERLQSSLDALSPHATIPLRMGVMLWKQGVEPQELFDHARVACNMAQGYIFSRPLSAQDFEETYFVRAVGK